jgi:sugar lactone lactonase YvrE
MNQFSRVVRWRNDVMAVGGAFAAMLGCSSGEKQAATTDTTAKRSVAPPAMYTSAGATDGFKTPESVRYDADLDVFFVSNINGNASQKDNNGYIAKIDGSNPSGSTTLVEGGKNGVTLNAPKGLAIVGDTLWVADIDAVRGFNKKTGASVATVDLGAMKAGFLNDLVVGPDGALYVTDSGIHFDAKGAMTHPGRDRIFKIVGRKATVAIEGDQLTRPNGIAWDAANSRFLLAPFGGPNIQAWKVGDTTVTTVATGPGGYDGIEVLSDARVLVTSWADSAVHVIKDGKLERVINSVEAPADIGIDTKRNLVAVPRFNAGKVEYWHVPTSP